MSDAFEDNLRAHFAERAAHVHATPDPGALMELAASRSGRRRTMVLGAAALAAVILLGSGVFAGAQLVGRTSTPRPLTAAAPSTTVPGRSGATLAPSPAGGPGLPANAGPTPYTFLFARTTSSGVTIRSYLAESVTGSCPQGAPCPLVTSPPGSPACPQGATCTQPSVTPQAQSGSTTGSGTGNAAGSTPAGSTGGTPVPLPPVPAGSTTTSTVPPPPVAECDQMIVELSTDKAVASASVARPDAAPSADTLEILGEGSFGTEEGAPVGWVAVTAGSKVASVNLMSGSTVVDTMAPSSGIVVLVTPGNAGWSGLSLVGVDQNGATIATAPLDQASGIEGPMGCTPLPLVAPTTPSPTTAPLPASPTNSSAAP